MQLRKAERKRQNLRIALCSPPGGGKTFTALRLAHALGGPVGVIDTESGSAELYAGEPNPDGGVFDFATIDLAAEPGKFSVDNYVRALHAMHDAGIKTVVVDSGSHAWSGEGGVLEYVDEVARRSKTPGNKFVAWAEGTPKHNEWIQALLNYPGHLILTLRTKMEFVQEKDGNGKTQVRRVGLAPIQRDGIEYEFTVVGELDVDTHRLNITKSRCSALSDRSFVKPGADVANVLLRWLDGGAPPLAPKPEPPMSAKEQHDSDAASRRKLWHESWDADRAGWCARMSSEGRNPDLAMDVIARASKGIRPSAMDPVRRAKATEWLLGEAGTAAYEAVVSERERE